MIKPDDAKLLKPGDIIYSWYAYRMGNTTLRCRSIYETEVTEVNTDADGSVVVRGRWNLVNAPKLLDLRQYFLYHPTPDPSEYRFEQSGSYERDVASAKAIAAEERAAWRARRKSLNAGAGVASKTQESA